MDGEGTHSPMDENGWLPIETAPKDGSSILVGLQPRPTDPCGAVDQAEWDDGWIAIGGKCDAGNGLGYEPTHWQPLPNPPVLKEQGT